MHSSSSSSRLENISDVNTSPVPAQAQQNDSKNETPSTRFQGFRQSYQTELPDSMSTVHKKNNGCNKANNGLEKQTSAGNSQDLSHDDLLLLLSILEGELQARDEVITVLRAEKLDLALLEANYGIVTPSKVLQALQRDTIWAKDHGWWEDIYEKPIAKLDKLVEKHNETYRRMLEQLLLVEQAHRQTLYRLEDEKHNHKEYMKKSDEFTSLLEQERARLKLLSDQEKTYLEHREAENNRQVTKLKEELTKLKSFALLVIDEQQRAQEELNSVQTKSQTMASKVLHLEAELKDKAVQFHREQEVMNTKLANETNQARQLCQKLATLSQKTSELEKINKALCRAEEELKKLREKKSEENGNSSLVCEVEELRKRVVEMEGKDEELINMENVCRDLKRKLDDELAQNRSLKAELDKLNEKVVEIKKCDVFAESKQECCSIKCNLEREQIVTRHMCNELDNLRVRIKELEATESLLEKNEWTLKEDIRKLKTLTLMLVDERKNMAEKLKQLENKVQDSTAKLQDEQEKVTLVTEKLIEESKNAFKMKIEMEEKIGIATKESNDLKMKLNAEEEKSNALQLKVSLMKKRLQSLEAFEKQFLRNKAKEETTKRPIQDGSHQDDNKINLPQEVERLRRKVKCKINVAEEDLLKTQNESKSLGNRRANENALMEELEIVKKELSNYQLEEKEKLNQEHVLYKQLREEEVKCSHLTQEVEALKETIHSYMDTESMYNMKTEYASVQKRLIQQEIRNKEVVREKESLTRELERYRRFSKILRPGMLGRRLSDLQVSTKEVQTEPTDSCTSTYKNVSLLEQALDSNEVFKEKSQQYEHNVDDENASKCVPVLKISNIHTSDTKQLKNTVLNAIEKQHLDNCNIQHTQNRTCIQEGDVPVTRNPSQHLHIKVTPDFSGKTCPGNKNSSTETVQSTATTVIPASGYTSKQIALIHNPPVSSHSSIKSPAVSKCTSLPDHVASPTEIPTITGDSNKVQKTRFKVGYKVFCVTPQNQNDCNATHPSNSNPSVNKKDKLHINLSIPRLQTAKSSTAPASFSPEPEQRTLESSSDIPAKDNTQTASSTGIKASSTTIPQLLQFTVPVEEFQQSGLTKVPKPKGYRTQAGTNFRAAQSTGTAQPLPKLGNIDVNTKDLFTRI